MRGWARPVLSEWPTRTQTHVCLVPKMANQVNEAYLTSFSHHIMETVWSWEEEEESGRESLKMRQGPGCLCLHILPHDHTFSRELVNISTERDLRDFLSHSVCAYILVTEL